MADRFGWIGATRRAALIKAVERAVIAWSKDWAVGTRVWTSVTAEGDAPTSVFRSPQGHLALAASRPLASFLTGIDEGERAGTLDVHIEKEALRTLDVQLEGVSATALVEVAIDALPASMTRAELGSSRIRLRSEDFFLDVWLDRALADRLAPAAGSRTEALVPRTSALDGATVSLRTELDLGTIALASIRHLRPGDVIATSTPLDSHFDLVEFEKGTPLFAASLGAKGTHRAVRIFEPKG